METHEGKSKDLKKTKFQNCKSKRLLRPHPLKFLPHNSEKGDKLSWYWHPIAVGVKTSTETHRIDGKGGISSTLRSPCELKTDLDKLQVIENGSKQGLRLLPISLSFVTINFCYVLTRIYIYIYMYVYTYIHRILGCTTCTHMFHVRCWTQKMSGTQKNSGYLICTWTE